jgi:hypothetical protein
LRITVRGHAVGLGKPCPFLGDGGCEIYEQRPIDPCRNFICGWLVHGSHLPDWMRPDRANVIVLGGNFKWREFSVDVAITTAGRRPNDDAVIWLRQYGKANRRPLLYQVATDWYAFGPRKFQLEMAQRIAAGESLCTTLGSANQR